MVYDFISMKDGECQIKLQERHLNQQEDIFHSLEDIIEMNQPTSILLDLSNIQRLNSNGIGRLVYLKRFIEEDMDLGFSVSNINPQTMKTLKSVKVDLVLGIQS